MRESIHMLIAGILGKAAFLVLALSLLVALGLNPPVMQRHMANAGPVHEVSTGEMPSMVHEGSQATTGEFCVQMAPCIAIIGQEPEMRAVEPFVAQLKPAPMPLADSRALAPPFHPPIV